MARVLAGTASALDTAVEDWRAGRQPAELLFGYNHLEAAGHDVSAVRFDWAADGAKRGWEAALDRATRGRLGNPRYGAAVLAQARGADLVYHSHLDTVSGLALARRARLLRKPLVVIADPLYSVSRLNNIGVLGVSRLISVTRAGRDRVLAEVKLPHDDPVVLPWGPDLDFAGYRPATSPGEGIISTGRTMRSHASLLEAAGALGAPTRISCLAPELAAQAPPNVGVVSAVRPFTEVMDDMRAAAVVAIPIAANPWGAVGLTELNAAMALAKPVVMHPNPYIDVDVEAIGMGFVVGDDPAQWHRALSELLAGPEGAAERGAAGRRYAERHWNNALFGQGVVEVVDSVLERA